MSTNDKYTGMTVNERLFAIGKSIEFDNAVLKRDVNKLKEILREVEVDESSIRSILEKLSLSDK